MPDRKEFVPIYRHQHGLGNKAIAAAVVIVLLAAAAAWVNRGAFSRQVEPASGDAGKGAVKPSIPADAAALLRDAPKGGADAIANAHAALGDLRPQVREAAVVSLGSHVKQADSDRLARVVKEDDSPDVRAAAVDVLARQDRWENISALITGLRDKDESVRRRAHRAIRDMIKMWIPFDPAASEEARERDVSSFEKSYPAMERRYREFVERKSKENKP
jgi:hypothetical protein